MSAEEAGHTAEQRAEQAVELWETTEGESMREGHAFTMRAVIASAIRAAEQDAAAAANAHIRELEIELEANTREIAEIQYTAAKQEREACAQAADLHAIACTDEHPGRSCAECVAAAIRQRGQR